MRKSTIPSQRWRPIKTAPLDEIILLAQPPINYGEYPWRIMQGRWIEVHHSNFLHKCLIDGVEIPEVPPGHWVGCYHGIMLHHGNKVDGMHSYEERPECLYPTHWMPLPKPPKGKFKRPSSR